MKVVGGAARLLGGAIVTWWVMLATLAPEVPRACALGAIAVFLTALWRPPAALLLVAAVAPACALLAAPPARAAELLAWALLAGWLLRLWQPLASMAWPRTLVIPAAVYGGALIGSWLTLTVGGAAGVPISSLPEFLWRSIPPDHLVFSSPEPETWTMLQSLTGVAVLVASAAVIRGDARRVRALVWTLVASLAVLAGATLFDVLRQWSEVGYEGWFLLRYFRGERFSLHLADLNAAGSLYVLAGTAAAASAILGSSHRGRWLIPLLPIVPALWLTGSRSSYLAGVGGLLILAVAQRRWPLTRQQAAAAVAVVSLVLLAGAATLDWQPDVRGSAGRAVNLRSQFLETSARMFGSSPAFGVGVGRYFDRSPEFMPADLREIYGNENAHNYFAQQFAELGIAGGLVFLWLVAAIVSIGWTVARDRNADAATVGLFAGIGAYLLTCLTGHPLLVPEAALPFWIACGALVGLSRPEPPRHRVHGAMAAVACALLAAGVARAAVPYTRATSPPPEHGFHGTETAADGAAFRWMTRHAVTYIPNGEGFLRLRVHAPDIEMPRTLILETVIAGRVADRREVPPGRWITYDIPARRRASAPFRRVDVRANQVWTQELRLGRRQAQRPIAAMLAEIRWIPLEEVGSR